MDREAAQKISLPPWLGLGARLALGAVLAASGTMKAAAPAEEFAVVIANYDILPAPMVVTVAHILPWLELLAGYALAFGYMTRAAAIAGGAMAGSFMAALLSAKLRGFRLPNCGCFGEGVHLTTTQALGLDLFLLFCAFASFRSGAAMASLDNWMYNGRRDHASQKINPRH